MNVEERIYNNYFLKQLCDSTINEKEQKYSNHDDDDDDDYE